MNNSLSGFPPTLLPALQLGFLSRQFASSLTSSLGFRAIADRTDVPIAIGETLTLTRKGLKAPIETPQPPGTNLALDNGLIPSGWTIEQYSLSLNLYGDSIDLNQVTSQVAIEDLFLANGQANGVQAHQSLDRLARNALYGAYLTGNSRVLGGSGNLLPWTISEGSSPSPAARLPSRWARISTNWWGPPPMPSISRVRLRAFPAV